jgi:hypothetical protein
LSLRDLESITNRPDALTPGDVPNQVDAGLDRVFFLQTPREICRRMCGCLPFFRPQEFAIAVLFTVQEVAGGQGSPRSYFLMGILVRAGQPVRLYLQEKTAAQTEEIHGLIRGSNRLEVFSDMEDNWQQEPVQVVAHIGETDIRLSLWANQTGRDKAVQLTLETIARSAALPVRVAMPPPGQTMPPQPTFSAEGGAGVRRSRASSAVARVASTVSTVPRGEILS